MDQIRVSIVVRTHNAAATLERALTSAAQQWYAHNRFEIVIVDDGSTDQSREIAASFAFPQGLQVVRTNSPMIGAVAAANLGFEAAQGELVVPLDADDELDPSLVRFATFWMSAHRSAGLAYSDYYEECGGKFKLKTPASALEVPFVGMVFRRSEFQRCGGLRTDVFFADHEFVLRVWDTMEIGYIHSPLFVYHRNPASLTGNQERVERGMEQLRQLHPDKLELIEKIRQY